MRQNCSAQVESTRYVLRASSVQSRLSADYTGRLIVVGDKYHAAQRWLENYEILHGEYPELERRLLQSLGPAEAHTFAEPLFRGRFLCNPPDSFQDFGPPPPDKARRGRYNTEGVPVLSLCSTVNGVVRELRTPSQGRKLWIQRFQLLPGLRMADARALAKDSLAAAVFLLIEAGRERSQERPQLGARVGQLIAAEYDGLIVPGVRGELKAQYWNAVIFRPEGRWLQLVDTSAPPEELY